MGLGLDECLLDNYLFTLTNVLTLSNAFHVPPLMAILGGAFVLGSSLIARWIFFLSNLPEQCSLLPT
jgi:hypothetical protein